MAELRATLAATKTITEKELIAAAILNMSPRKERPLITFNCAALPANLGEAGMYLLKS
jgi:transcriptional regulator with GAF, ATPase, and Fis domain